MRTGDLGIVDAEGNIFIRGRNKSMILGPSGQNIYPEEIEDKLNTLPYVMESVVVERKNMLVALVFLIMRRLKMKIPISRIWKNKWNTIWCV